jgi:hypothetical protein
VNFALMAVMTMVMVIYLVADSYSFILQYSFYS